MKWLDSKTKRALIVSAILLVLKIVKSAMPEAAWIDQVDEGLLGQIVDHAWQLALIIAGLFGREAVAKVDAKVDDLHAKVESGGGAAIGGRD
jgi:hypothetical protein